MHGYKCEYCKGFVKDRLVKKEVFKHKARFVILQDMPVGICDRCGYKYYHSIILKKVKEIASSKIVSEKNRDYSGGVFVIVLKLA